MRPDRGTSVARKLSFNYDCSWPGPGLLCGRRKLTLAGRAVAPKVIFLARPRIHTTGQEQTFKPEPESGPSGQPPLRNLLA